MSVKGRSKGEILSFKIGKKFLYNNMLPKNIAAYLYLDERKVPWRGGAWRGGAKRGGAWRGGEKRGGAWRGGEKRGGEKRGGE